MSRAWIACAVAWSAGLLACASPSAVKRTWRAQALGEARTLAVVSACVEPRLLAMRGEDELPYRGEDVRTATGSASAVFARTLPQVLEALAEAGAFTLVPEDRVLAALPVEPGAPDGCELAPGYAAPRPPREAAALVRRLGVDVVATVRMFFGYEGATLDYGPDAVGSFRGRAVLAVAAVDRNGAMVWRDVVSGASRESFTSRRSRLDEDVLSAAMQDAAADATVRLVARLRERAR